jgi:DNA-binding NarL/FixJ family response regulator
LSRQGIIKERELYMDLIICFIDDSDFEHDLVRNEIAPCAPDITFVQAHTFREADGMLRKKIPGLFLLDLWGQDTKVSEPYLTPKEELEVMVSRFNTLDYVYAGLDDYGENRNNEYLKRLFAIVDSWRAMFEKVCERIGQNRAYGLENFRQARMHYPGIPAVFYTRKSLIKDAVAVLRSGADGLFIKPTGKDDSETVRLTREYAPELIEELSVIVEAGIEDMQKYKDFYWKKRDNRSIDVEEFVTAWKKYINNRFSRALP